MRFGSVAPSSRKLGKNSSLQSAKKLSERAVQSCNRPPAFGAHGRLHDCTFIRRTRQCTSRRRKNSEICIGASCRSGRRSCSGLHPLLLPRQRLQRAVATVCLCTGHQVTGYDPGTTPPRAKAAPSGLAQKRDNGTHRPERSSCDDLMDRGPLMPKVANSGAGEKPAGERLATEKRHRADTGQTKGLPLQAGGRNGGRILFIKIVMH